MTVLKKIIVKEKFLRTKLWQWKKWKNHLKKENYRAKKKRIPALQTRRRLISWDTAALLITFVWWEKKPEDWENSTVIHVQGKGDKQKVENYREFSLLNACFKLCSKSWNEKLKARAEKILSGMPVWIPKRQILHRSTV